MINRTHASSEHTFRGDHKPKGFELILTEFLPGFKHMSVRFLSRSELEPKSASLIKHTPINLHLFTTKIIHLNEKMIKEECYRNFQNISRCAKWTLLSVIGGHINAACIIRGNSSERGVWWGEGDLRLTRSWSWERVSLRWRYLLRYTGYKSDVSKVQGILKVFPNSIRSTEDTVKRTGRGRGDSNSSIPRSLESCRFSAVTSAVLFLFPS